MENMKLIGIIAVVFIIGFGTGMLSANIFNTNNPELNKDISDFIGSWSATEYSYNESNGGVLYYTWSFYENQTMHILIEGKNETSNITVVDTWQGYELINEKLEIESPTGAVLKYEYSFSNNKKELTLSKDDKPMTFHKI